MNRWSVKEKRMISNPKVDAFLVDIIKVCRQHKMAIGHEDSGGGFIISSLSDVDDSILDWIGSAADNTRS